MPGWNLDQDTKYPQNFRGFPQSLQTNDWKVSQTGIRPLTFTSFLLLYSLVFLLFELIQSVKKRLQTLRKVGSTHLNKRQSIYVITSIPSKIRTDKCPDTTVDSRHQHRFSINVWVGILWHQVSGLAILPKVSWVELALRTSCLT